MARAATAVYRLSYVYYLMSGQLESVSSVINTTERSRVFIYDKSATSNEEWVYTIVYNMIINNIERIVSKE